MKERALIVSVPSGKRTVCDDWNYIDTGVTQGWLRYDLWYRDSKNVLWHRYLTRKDL